jgi:hypothetical protein
MSVTTMARVWATSSHSGTDLLMLLAIADFSDDDGRAYPAVGTLAKKCRMTDRNARLILANLRGSGELIVRVGEGPKGANQYLVANPLKGASAPLKDSSALKRTSATPEAGFRLPLKPASAKPSVNHQEPSEKKKRRTRLVEKTFAEWIDDVRASGEKPVSDYLAVWSYADKIGLPADFVELAWLKFRDRYSSDGNYKAKTYADWRRTFLNAVRDNWFKLWYRDGDAFRLTTAGQQADLETRGAE